MAKCRGDEGAGDVVLDAVLGLQHLGHLGVGPVEEGGSGSGPRPAASTA
jgi:hypothetical protein